MQTNNEKLKMNIGVKGVLLLAMLIVLSCCLFACSDKEGDCVVIAFGFEDELFITDMISDLPKLEIAVNDKIEDAAYTEFWFDAEYLYAYNGKLYVKEDAPPTFADTLKVTYKRNMDLTAEIRVEKVLVPIERVVINNERKKNTCLVGEKIQLTMDIFPSNASERNPVLSVVEGNAKVTEKNILRVFNSAQAGEHIVIEASSEDGTVYGTCTLTVKERIPISNAAELFAIRNAPDEDYVLVNDISDFTGYTNRVLIQEFRGTLEGNGFAINNYRYELLNRTYAKSQCFGLFALLYGTVKNLTMNAVYIYADPMHGGDFVYVGAIAGANYGSIINCAVSGQVVIHRDASAAGGLVGYNRGIIEDCTFGSMDGDKSYVVGNGDLGGIAGQSGNLLTGCWIYNSAIELYIVHNNRSAGGIVGFNFGGELSHSMVIATEVVYFGPADIDWIQPNMGIIVGSIIDSKLFYVGRENAGVNAGELSKQQLKFCAQGGWGECGYIINTKVK